jgi:ribose 5-phosphate isomerase B
MDGKLKIAIASDHGGFVLKGELISYLAKKGHKVEDFGAYSIEASDYPVLGHKAARAVGSKRADYGIVICKTGFGMAIVANKVKGVRSAVCDTPDEARSAREHNDCNVLSLAATRLNTGSAKKIVDTFLKTDFEGGRHQRRVKQIINLEK